MHSISYLEERWSKKSTSTWSSQRNYNDVLQKREANVNTNFFNIDIGGQQNYTPY